MPTTLSSAQVIGVYVEACQQLWGGYEQGSIDAIRRSMIAKVNNALRGSGVPPVGIEYDPTDDSCGTFQFTTWAIRFGGGLAGDRKTAKLFAETVDTVYHEARHCEQWFRIAQGLAAGKIPRPQMLTVPFPDKTAASIATFMGIPLAIAQKAVSTANTNPVAEVLVRGWFASIYGSGATPRGIRLSHINARYEDYRRLAEEQDAWLLGTDVGDRVRVGLHLKFPTLHDWKLATARSGHFRSGHFFGGADTLTRVDQAIAGLQRTHGKTEFDALATAFKAWWDANPKERTARNVPLDGEADGIVDKLKKILAAGYGAWRTGQVG